MSRGIYIVANDRVLENAIALLNSIRLYDAQVPVFLIPFNEEYQTVANILEEKHQVKIFPYLDFLANFTEKIGNIFDRDFLNLPNKMRKLAVWFGPLDEFIYIDTDIIVFEKIANILDYLAQYDFICCDYHHSGRGLKDIFSSLVKEQNIFTEEQLQDVFNSGFWAAKKSIFSVEKMKSLLKECAAHKEYFDFSSKVTDQPILNYLILRATNQRLNLVKLPGKQPGSWAGSKHFQEKNHILYDGEQPLKYLHWAGTPMKPGAPYRDLWEYYRYLGETKPTVTVIEEKKNPWQKILDTFALK